MVAGESGEGGQVVAAEPDGDGAAWVSFDGGDGAWKQSTGLLDLREQWGGARLYFGSSLFAMPGFGLVYVVMAVIFVRAALRGQAPIELMSGWIKPSLIVAAASVLVLVGPVDWSAVAPLAVGLLAGSTLGPAVTRRVPAHLVRWTAATLGLLLALRLWLSPR